MNKIGLFFVLGLMLAVFAVSASAVLTLTSNPMIGSSSQQRGLNSSVSMTLTNNETSDVPASLTFTPITADGTTAANALDREYTSTTDVVTFKNSTLNVITAITVPANSTPLTVTVTGFVPRDFDSVRVGDIDVAFKIGTITATYGSGLTATTALYMVAENGLLFDSVKITVGDSTDTVQDGDTVDELKPGNMLDLEVSAESKFDEDDWDYDIENVEVAAEIDDSDFDFDESEDLSDLSPKDTDSVTFSNIVVDTEADGSYDLVVTVSGTDENGAVHGESMTVELKVERETHEVIITKAQLTKPTVKCVDGEFEKTDAKISVLNIGKRDEEKASVEAVISDLDITVSKDSLTLDKDDAATYTLSLQVPKGTKAGTYDVDVIAAAVNGVETDSKTLSLTVEACAATTATTTATATTGTTATTTAGTTATTVTATAPTARISSKAPFTETNTYLYVLGGVVVVLLVSTIWIGIKLAALAK